MYIKYWMCLWAVGKLGSVLKPRKYNMWVMWQKRRIRKKRDLHTMFTCWRPGWNQSSWALGMLSRGYPDIKREFTNRRKYFSLQTNWPIKSLGVDRKQSPCQHYTEGRKDIGSGLIFWVVSFSPGDLSCDLFSGPTFQDCLPVFQFPHPLASHVNVRECFLLSKKATKQPANPILRTHYTCHYFVCLFSFF